MHEVIKMANRKTVITKFLFKRPGYKSIKYCKNNTDNGFFSITIPSYDGYASILHNSKILGKHSLRSKSNNYLTTNKIFTCIEAIW